MTHGGSSRNGSEAARADGAAVSLRLFWPHLRRSVALEKTIKVSDFLREL